MQCVIIQLLGAELFVETKQASGKEFDPESE